MANLRDIRRRIKSTKNMQQITKAMKAVAAAKMRKAQEAVTLARPYSKRIKSVLGRVAVVSGGVNNPLLEVREPKKVAYIVISADRGLCGGFNSNIIKLATQELKATSAEISLITVGRKAHDFFVRRGGSNIAKQYVGLGDNIMYGTVRDIASFVIDKYANQEYDVVYLIYSQFVNVMVQKPLVIKLLPAEPPAAAGGADESKKIAYIFEPSPEAVLAELLPKYIENAIYQGLLETKAGFYSAQMTSMENATKSASDMIDKLTMFMNRARQAQITTEISEIVGGVAALE
ncbi:MAG: ATP synthase F1 subunit gamma [Desulfotomaculaceae bacterium]|nr:ATP synthase F1 subunit gamma [Desulfotomaculaceae bacterium]